MKITHMPGYRATNLFVPRHKCYVERSPTFGGCSLGICSNFKQQLYDGKMAPPGRNIERSPTFGGCSLGICSNSKQQLYDGKMAPPDRKMERSPTFGGF